MPVLLVYLILFLASPVWGVEGPFDPLSARWASWFSDQGVPQSPHPAATTAYQVTLTPTFHGRPSALASVRELSRDLERPRTEGMLAKTIWLKGAFTTETEVATNQSGDDSIHSSVASHSVNDPSTRMMRFGFVGSAGPLRYGVTYRNAGQAFYDDSDRAVKEVWSEWKQGVATVSSALGQQWNNVAADPTRVRMDQNYGRVGVSVTPSTWSVLALTYQKKALNSTLIPAGALPQNVHDQTVEAALGYNGAFWTARLASSYSLLNDPVQKGDSRVTAQTVTASFRPLTTLTIAPMFGYRDEQQEWSGLRIASPSASVAMSYRQSQQLLISTMANYSIMRSSDRLVDVETIGGKGMLAWDLQQSQDWTTLLSFEAGFNRQHNYVLPSAQTDDLSGILRLVLSPL
jgi:hypothetical protein